MSIKQPQKGLRLADLAKAAGVSKGTASNVFNHPTLVREPVRRHVLAVAKKIGYLGPDPKGRMLSAGKVNAIGVATTQTLAYFFSDPFSRELMTVIAERCGHYGVGISLISAIDSTELVWNIRNAVVDGIVLLCLDGDQKLIELARERAIPFVSVAFGGNEQDIAVVGIDNYHASRTAAEHLCHLGHRRVAILTMELCADNGVGPVSAERLAEAFYLTSIERLNGYRAALQENGIRSDEVPVFETLSDEASVHQAMSALFAGPQPPTAILAQSDVIAIHALAWLKQQQIRVPEQVSVVGFDGVTEAALCDPPLTTIVQPIAEIGHSVVTRLLEPAAALADKPMAAELAIRGSTAAAPSEDL